MESFKKDPLFIYSTGLSIGLSIPIRGSFMWAAWPVCSLSALSQRCEMPQRRLQIQPVAVDCVHAGFYAEGKFFFLSKTWITFCSVPWILYSELKMYFTADDVIVNFFVKFLFASTEEKFALFVKKKKKAYNCIHICNNIFAILYRSFHIFTSDLYKMTSFCFYAPPLDLLTPPPSLMLPLPLPHFTLWSISYP